MSHRSFSLSSSIIGRSVKASSPKLLRFVGRCLFGSTSTFCNVDPIDLHTEWIAPEDQFRGNVNNQSDIGNGEKYTFLFLHGLLGNGRNLKTFARKVVKQQSSNHGICRGGILVDLRGHGNTYQSQRKVEMNAFSTASTFLECAQDIDQTLEGFYEKITAPRTTVLVGHSLGGRISLEYAANIANASSSKSKIALKAVWLLDTVPGQANENVEKVLATIANVLEETTMDNTDPREKVRTKKEIVKVLTDSPNNMDLPTAQWLAMSYDEKSGDNFGFDNNFVDRLKSEFTNQDFIGLLQKILRSNRTNDENVGNTHVHLVRGGKNTEWSIPILSELEKVKKNYPTTFHIHVLPSAGHNVHVDDLPGLVKLFAES